jgi:hypothetical protein
MGMNLVFHYRKNGNPQIHDVVSSPEEQHKRRFSIGQALWMLTTAPGKCLFHFLS